jgi:hypothetical protein
MIDKFTKNEWELDEFNNKTVRCSDRGEVICSTEVATEKPSMESEHNAKLISILPVIIDRLDGLYSDIRDGYKVDKNFESYKLAENLLDFIHAK